MSNYYSLFVFTARFFPQACGVGEHSAHLQAFAAQNFQRIGILTNEGKEGTDLINVPTKTKFQWWFRWAHENKNTHLLWQYSPYSLHSKGTPWWLVPVMLWLRLKGVRQAVFFHEVQIRYSVSGLYNKWRALQQQIIANLCTWLAAGRVATSIPLYQTYFWRSKPQLIPISPNLLPQFGIPVRPFRVVAFANRIFPWLLQALAEVQQIIPDLEVVWLGQKSETATEEDIMLRYGLLSRFTDKLPQKLLAGEMQAAALVLLPLALGAKGVGGISLKSGTLSAALAMAKPVIASAGDMTQSDLLVHGKVLHLLYNNQADSWKMAILQLLQQKDYHSRLAVGGHSFYLQNLSWEKTAPAIFSLLEP